MLLTLMVKISRHCKICDVTGLWCIVSPAYYSPILHVNRAWLRWHNIFGAAWIFCRLRDIFQVISGITRKFKLRHKIGATKWVVAVPSDCRCSDGCTWWVLGNFGTEEIVAKFGNKMFTRQLKLSTCGIIIDHLDKIKSDPRWSTN